MKVMFCCRIIIVYMMLLNIFQRPCGLSTRTFSSLVGQGVSCNDMLPTVCFERLSSYPDLLYVIRSTTEETFFVCGLCYDIIFSILFVSIDILSTPKTLLTRGLIHLDIFISGHMSNK